jgi:hypothetical protein
VQTVRRRALQAAVAEGVILLVYALRGVWEIRCRVGYALSQ